MCWQEACYLLDSISQPHDVSRLPADLGLGGVQEDVEICHILKLGVIFLTGIHKVLNFCHGEFPNGNTTDQEYSVLQALATALR